MTEFREQRFETSEELIAWLKEVPDDIESITIMVVNDLPISGGPQGRKLLAKNSCGLIKHVNGQSTVIHRDELQKFINEELTRKLRIPIALLPLVDRGD